MAEEASTTPEGSALLPGHTSTAAAGAGLGLQNVIVEPTKVPAEPSASTRTLPASRPGSWHVQLPCSGLPGRGTQAGKQKARRAGKQAGYQEG
jgi:hypothetical protein